MRNRLQKISLRSNIVLLLFAWMMSSSTYSSAQCASDGTSPVISNCTSKSISLDPGECTSSILTRLYATDNCPGKNFAFSPVMSNTFEGGYVCNSGGVSMYYIVPPSAHLRPTPSAVRSIDLGIHRTTSPTNVMVRVYETDGTMNPFNWKIVGGGNRLLPAGLVKTTQNISVSATSIFPDKTYAVEVVAPSSASGDTIIAMTTSTASINSFFRAPGCGVSTLTPVTGRNAIVNINLFGEPTYLYQPTNPGYTQDDYFEEGVYNFSYIATDASTNTASCTFTLTVNGVASPVTSITCNDLVNISLDDNCESVVGADEILEGGPYSCYEDYTVVIYNTNNVSIGNTLNANHVGKKLKVEVIAPNNNKCWGEILVEDKNPPVLECDDVYTTCVGGDHKPGSALPSLISFKATTGNGNISSSTASSTTYEIDVFGLQNVTMTDVDFMVEIEHGAIGQLSGTLEGPDGTFVNLFAGAGSAVSCPNGGLMITLDDQATFTQTDLANTCNATSPAAIGVFKPTQALAVFNGKDPLGKWKVTINDNAAGIGGSIKNLVLVIKQNGARLPFPTTKNVTYNETGPNTYSLVGLDACGVATLSYRDSIEQMTCSSIYDKIIKRTWTAVDQYGNTAIPCNQYIYVYRNGLSTLKFPPNYDGIERPTFSCTQWGMTVPPANAQGAGAPTGDFCSNIQIFPPVDTKIDVCAKSYKLLRKWKVVEWCNNQVIEHIQIIKVEDKEGPSLDCAPDTIISTMEFECTADFSPRRPTVTDAGCSEASQIKLELSYYFSPDGTLPANAIFTGVAGSTLSDLPLGVTYIRWTATDDCKNSNSCTRKVTVRDMVPPVAVCDQFTVVSVGSNGEALVDALTFDDFSYDNCELKEIKVAKMTNRCSGENTQFKDRIKFCCTEIGSSVMVQLRVTDVFGNSNTCMVEAKVQDKLPPYITCPDDITLDCFEDHKDLELTGEPDAVDNCEVVSINFNDSGSVDNCGEGRFNRTWTIKDKAGFSASCVQIITLKDSDSFDVNDITWPRDYDATTCNSNLDPDNLPLVNARPRLATKNCSLTSMTYRDQVFTFVDGSCEKILRYWTVIDWCTYNEDTGEGIYTYPQYKEALQIIKLTNSIKPTFVSCSNKTVDVFGDCKGEVEQGVEATDDCTPSDQLKYSYTIDPNNDGVGANIIGTTNTFKRELPIGVHKVTWTVEDKCGNKETCMYLLTVRDGKKPTPYCLSSITTVVMQTSGMITVWAKDFDYGSFDNCTPKSQLKFSFTENVKDSSRVFTCDDIIDGVENYVPITMWVFDQAGNKDFCSIGLILQDNTANVCNDETRVAIGGKIVSENNTPMTDVDVMAKELSHEILVQKVTTQQGGSYNLSVSQSSDVKVVAEKEDSYINGVSTLDLVIIQRHILGLEQFSSPYKTIAADVTNDQKISASDLVALRKLILGLSLDFPNGQKSWRFVDKTQTFNDPTRPWPFTEEMLFNDIQNQKVGIDFVGIKIGDVNGNAKINFRSNDTDVRTKGKVQFTYESETIEGAHYVNIFAEEDIDASGMQIGISTMAKPQSITSEILNINEGDYTIDGNTIKLAWAPKANTYVKAGQKLFTVRVSESSKVVNLNSDFTSEMYDATLTASEILIAPRGYNGAVKGGLLVLQNHPNPFDESTQISFELSEKQEVAIEVTDVTGKVLYNNKNAYTAGRHTVTLQGQELGAQGVLFCKVSADGQSEIRKMIRIRK